MSATSSLRGLIVDLSAPRADGARQQPRQSLGRRPHNTANEVPPCRRPAGPWMRLHALPPHAVGMLLPSSFLQRLHTVMLIITHTLCYTHCGNCRSTACLGMMMGMAFPAASIQGEHCGQPNAGAQQQPGITVMHASMHPPARLCPRQLTPTWQLLQRSQLAWARMLLRCAPPPRSYAPPSPLPP